MTNITPLYMIAAGKLNTYYSFYNNTDILAINFQYFANFY